MKKALAISELTDEDVLREFVKRFKCDAAVLIYLESDTEFGFGRWRNSVGRKWTNDLFEVLQRDALTEGAIIQKRRVNTTYNRMSL